MAKPHIHSESSVKKFGGEAEDYIEIHKLLDSSRAVMGDLRHRALTHNSWFISVILPKIFGDTITNSDGRVVDVTRIGEEHIFEDYGNKFIPTPDDFLSEMEMRDWMKFMGGDRVSYPPSRKKTQEEDLEEDLTSSESVSNDESQEDQSFDLGSLTPDSEAEFYQPGRGCGGSRSPGGDMVFD